MEQVEAKVVQFILTDQKKRSYFGSTAILGQSLGLAVGAGLANKIKKNKNISVAFLEILL